MHFIVLIILLIGSALGKIIRGISYQNYSDSMRKHWEKEALWYQTHEDKWLPASKRVTKVGEGRYRVKLSSEKRYYKKRDEMEGTIKARRVGVTDTFGIFAYDNTVIYTKGDLLHDEFAYLKTQLSDDEYNRFHEQWTSIFGKKHYYK